MPSAPMTKSAVRVLPLLREIVTPVEVAVMVEKDSFVRIWAPEVVAWVRRIRMRSVRWMKECLFGSLTTVDR